MANETNTAATGMGASEIRRVIHELRIYNPIADEYKGAHIHSVWARELEAALAAQPAPAGIEGAIATLVDALSQGKGWLRDYADGVIRDAIERTAQPAPVVGAIDLEQFRHPVQAWLAMLAVEARRVKGSGCVNASNHVGALMRKAGRLLEMIDASKAPGQPVPVMGEDAVYATITGLTSEDGKHELYTITDEPFPLSDPWKLYTHPAPLLAARPGGEGDTESCEGGQPECGPVEHHDSEGVPLCKVCWEGLLSDSAP